MSVKTYSDEDLIELMKMAISDSLESDYAEAFTTLYERRKDFIFLHCRKFTKAMKLPSNMEEEIFSEFFMNFKLKITRFDPSKSSSKNNPFKGWASTVLYNIAVDKYRKYRDRQIHETHLPDEGWDVIALIAEDTSPSEPLSTPERRAIQDALDNLNEIHREIVLEYARQRPINSSQRTPKGICDEIGAKFGTSGENVKMIYKRFRQAALQSLVPQ